jgi:hypothetical protein
MAKAVKASGRSLNVGHLNPPRTPGARPETAAMIHAFLVAGARGRDARTYTRVRRERGGRGFKER